MNNCNSFSEQISSLKDFFKKQFNSKKIHRLARSTKLIQRSTSKIKGLELVSALLECALDPKSSSLEKVADVIHEKSPEVCMSKQGLSQRINTPECTSFFKAIYKECLSTITNKITSHIVSLTDLKRKSLFNLFSQVVVIDCTEFALHHSLKESFKGSGGPLENAAAMKICAAFDLKSNCLLNTEITDRRCPDQGLGEKISLQNNSLAMFDLGFFSIHFLKKIQRDGSFFISRLHGSTDLYENESDQEPLDVGKFLHNKLKNGSIVDLKVYLGKQKLPVRLVGIKADEKSVKKRKKDYIKRCKKSKRVPSEEILERLEYGIFITNIPIEMVLAINIIKLFKLRWQIELIFKNWKSQLCIDHLPGKNVDRIQTLILSRLISISIIWMVSGYVKEYLEMYFDEELSMHKSINWLKHRNRFAEILLGRLKIVFKDFVVAAKKWLHKEKSPKKPTTKQLLDEFYHIDYQSIVYF